MEQKEIGFSNRLRHMFYVQMGIDLNQHGAPMKAARIIAQSGLYCPPTQDEKVCKSIRETLKNHLTLATAEKVTTAWLDIYCKLLNCSADYLMGYIDLPNHNKTDFAEYSGLSEDAINALKWLQQHDKNVPPSLRTIPALSRLLAHSMCADMLTAFARLFHAPEYTIPVYYDDDHQPQTLPDNNLNIQKSPHPSIPDRHTIHLANQNSNTLNDNLILDTDPNTMRSLAMMTIQQLLFLIE